MYRTGCKFWWDLLITYGHDVAERIANSYLDLQIKNDDSEELMFCKQLYTAMH